MELRVDVQMVDYLAPSLFDLLGWLGVRIKFEPLTLTENPWHSGKN